ncbi:MAG: BBP7 family outer membrane beta-barrel protein [Planctomycetes bacterium]|nr:BBP7 family outer membrane beta-barrel protein [Planctomycetota bacterium]
MVIQDNTPGAAEEAVEWDGQNSFEPGEADIDPDFGQASRCDSVYYVQGEFLHWWINGDDTPPLVTTSPQGTPRNQAGVLGQPGTTVLFGGDELNDDGRSGARIVLGRRLTDCANLEGEWFDLGELNTDFSATSTGNPILARPFFNVVTVAQDAYLVAYPAVREGTISVTSTSRMYGGAINVFETWEHGYDLDGAQLSVGLGMRFLRLQENLAMSDSLTSVDPVGPIPVGTQFSTSDSFDATNNFIGFNLGLRSQWEHQRWSLACAGNLGIGQTGSKVNISGRSSTTTPAGATTNFNGGLLALPTNMGNYERYQLGIVPQIQFKLAYEITHNARILVGYDAMLWTSVVRPGDLIDSSLNLTQASGQPLVGQASPAFSFQDSVLWVQGVSIGGELRF